MNHREPPQVPQGMRRDGHFLAALLLAVLSGFGPTTAHAGVLFTQSKIESATVAPCGYLPSRGAPPLRFSEIIVPAYPAPQLAAADPSKATSSASTQAGSATRPAEHPASADVSLHVPNSKGMSVSPASQEKPPLSILPDEARTEVRPEDFLPFFQIPGTGRNPDVTVLASPALNQPVNSPPQTSSATYIQTDK